METVLKIMKIGVEETNLLWFSVKKGWGEIPQNVADYLILSCWNVHVVCLLIQSEPSGCYMWTSFCTQKNPVQLHSAIFICLYQFSDFHFMVSTNCKLYISFHSAFIFSPFVRYDEICENTEL